MKTFVQAVKVCGALDLILLVSWLILLGVNPPVASHIAMVTLAGAAALLVGGMFSAPLWLPLGILAIALYSGNSILGAALKLKQQIFGGEL